MENCVSLLCPAKLNLVLNVPRRHSDGYHDIITVMQTVSLYDRITVKKASALTVTSKTAPCGEDNICYKAAKHFSFLGGAEIALEKRIPMAAGLGGGSSDAAGVLLALNRLYGEPYSAYELKNIALTLGSDVPFFLEGGTALVEGRGDKISKVSDFRGCFVLLKKGQKQSTGRMYGLLDEAGLCDKKAEVSRFLCGDVKEFFNDFERVYPASEEKALLLEGGAEAACLSGSGPTVFGYFLNNAAADKCAAEIAGEGEVFCCAATEKGIIFE